MTLDSGARLGHYQVASQLGVGGMGEVYRATDSNLGREVAIKVLPDEVARDPERLGRFKREAQLLAALNHPHIASIYGLEEADGQPFLVLELVDGEDLSVRLQRGAIPTDEAVDIARQVAEALEEAHDKGIVHRDLKPANIKLTADGKVKVLDFGLAKAFLGDLGGGSSTDLSRSPTLAHTGTQAGVILGTAAYMSPEQARGKSVGRRADVWAFGVVLYEMLTGHRLFDGETVTDIIAAVVTREPDWDALPADTPPPVRRVLERCLRKDPRTRLPDIGAVRLELSELDDAPAEAGGTPGRGRAGTAAWIVAVAATLAAGIGIGAFVLREAPDPRVIAFDVEPPSGTRFYLHSERPGVGTLSPDGRMLAFTAEQDGKWQAYLRGLDTAVASPVSGTEGAQYLFWSPDSRHLGFFAQGRLKKIQVAGGSAPPVTLCEAEEVKGASWGSQGVIVFAPNASSPLRRVSEAGGESVEVTQFDEARRDDSHRHPRFLPDGRHFVYLARVGGGSPDNAVVVGSIDGDVSTELLRSPAAAEYASGHLLFVREATLMARPFDADTLEFTGEAVPVAESVRMVAPATALAVFSAATGADVLTYEPGGGVSGQRLAWRDRTGREVGVLGDQARYWDVQLSPRGDLAAVTLSDGGGGLADVWLYEIARNLRTRLTFDPRDEWGGVWAPDGRTVYFSSDRAGQYDLYRVGIDGTHPDEALLASDRQKVPTSVSPDGRFLAYSTQTKQTGWDVLVLPLEGEREPIPFATQQYDEVIGTFSPDGRFIAYTSTASGQQEVYLAPFPGPGRRWQVSTQGGSWSQWRADGKEIFYLTTDGTLTAVAMDIQGADVKIGEPEALFTMMTPDTNFRFAVAPDGQRFLTVASETSENEHPLRVVVNWTRRLAQ